ncbi:MAG: hypothetical protein ACE5EQ_09120 [Phycisphaerae bacterium]
MDFLTALWLPILLSAVFVFIASSILHMVIPIHKGDFKKLPGEEKVLAAMREAAVPPGMYTFPCAGSMKACSDPEYIVRCKLGPIGFMTVMPGSDFGMGRNLVLWFLYSVLISVLTAYVGHHAGLAPGANYLSVFRVTGTVAVLAYGVAQLNDSIWKGAPWGSTLKFVFDGVVYGLVTAGTFGWLWPEA